MNAKPKTNSIVTSKVRDDDGAIEITVLKAGPANEHGQPTNAVLVLDPARIHADNKVRAMNMGFVSRIVDKAALPFDKAKGRYATPGEKFDAMRPLVEHLNSGSPDWSPARATIVRVSALDSLLLAAVCEGTGRGESEIRDMVKRGSEKRGVTQDVYLLALSQAKTIAPIVERMRADATAAFDADEELEAAMEGEGDEGGGDETKPE